MGMEMKGDRFNVRRGLKDALKKNKAHHPLSLMRYNT